MSFDADVVVVGAGVVGLACARTLVRRFPSLVVLERHDSFGQETSSRNSEVVHAGLYYEPGSLKARACLRGRELLYDLARVACVTARPVGKLVVAVTEAEERSLEALLARAHANGALDCRILDAAEVRRLEPAVRARSALLSPSTGLVDASGLMRHLAATAGDGGASLAYGVELTGVEPLAGGFRLRVRQDGATSTLTTRVLVNAAGLDADEVAAMAGIEVDGAGYRLRWVKGSYFAYGGPPLGLTHLVYPVPHDVGTSLGIHLVLDLGGAVRFGPDATPVPERRQDYRVDPSRRSAFGAAVRSYLPAVADAHLTEAFAGIRPKLGGPGDAARDFVVRHEVDRGLPGLVSLVGIDSPGLTSALALAEDVDRLLADLA